MIGQAGDGLIRSVQIQHTCVERCRATKRIQVNHRSRRQRIIPASQDQLGSPDVGLAQVITARACHLEKTICGVAAAKRERGARIASGDFSTQGESRGAAAIECAVGDLRVARERNVAGPTRRAVS